MFHNLVNKYPTELFVYMDNILITTKNNINHHRQIIDDILELLAKESYFLQPSKCVFEQTQIEYLCHDPSHGGSYMAEVCRSFTCLCGPGGYVFDYVYVRFHGSLYPMMDCTLRV